MSKSNNGQGDLFSSLAEPHVVSKRSARDKGIPSPRAPIMKPVRPPRPNKIAPTSPTTVEPACPYLSDRMVAHRYCVSRPTVWRWTKLLEGFPQPIRISSGTTRWRLTDLQAYDHREARAVKGGAA